MVNGDTTDSTRLRIQNTTQNANLRFLTNNSDFQFVTAGGASSLGVYDNNGAAYRLRLDSAGKLSIGNTVPSYQLDVFGGTGISGRFSGRVIGGDAVNSDEFVTKSQLDSVSGGAIGGSGTTNRLAYFDSSGSIANSWLLQNTGTLQLDSGRNLDLLGGSLTVRGAADQSQLIVRANATQTNPLILAQDSAGNELFRLQATDDTSIFLGYEAGASDDGTNNANLALGNNALKNTTSGSDNIAIGYEALLTNTTSSGNIALGSGSLSLTTGQYNAALGHQTGEFNASGGYNVLFGYRAGRGVAGGSDNSSANVIFGSGTGSAIDSADNNILLGAGSAETLTTGDNNILLGYDIEFASASTSNSLNIGNLLFGTGIDGTGTTVSSGSIGIGVIDPTTRLQAAGNITAGNAGSVNGSYVFERAANANTITLAIADQTTGSATITIPNVAGVSDTVCLVSYGNCGSTDEIFTVAADDTPATKKAAADYVADNSDDDIEINAALSANSGGKVVLLEGTFSISGTIAIPDNTTLEGNGVSSIIQSEDDGGSPNDFNMIENSDTSGGNNNVVVRNLTIDGNTGNISASARDSIYFENVGTGTGASAISGFLVDNVTIKNSENRGINAVSSTNSRITSSIITNTDDDAIYINQSDSNKVTNNYIGGSSGNGVRLNTAGSNQFVGNTIEGNTGDGFVIRNSSNYNLFDTNALLSNDRGFLFAGAGINSLNTINNNTINFHSNEALEIGTTTRTVVTGNSIYDNDDSGASGQILLSSNASHTIINGNFVRGTNDGSYAIDIGTTNDYTYLADNGFLDTAGINDLASNTIYANQLNADGDDSGADLVLQARDNVNIQSPTNITGNTDITGTLTVSSTVTLSNYDCSAANTFLTTNGSGLLSCAAASGGSGASDLQGAYDGGNTIVLASNNAVSIQDNSTPITGNLFEVTSNGGGSNYLSVDASTVNVGTNLVVAAQKSLTLTGGTTAQRPGSPTEGMLFFDTDTDRLLVYSNGKWQADRAESVIVAASDSSQAEKDSADYTADQAEINSAITTADGGRVYLLPGTYTLTAAIELYDDTTLEGAGTGTILTVGNSATGFNIIENEDQAGGNSNLTVRNLKIDGNDSGGASSVPAIEFDTVGSGTGASAVAGFTVSDVVIEDVSSVGIYIDTSFNSSVSGVTLRYIQSDGIGSLGSARIRVVNNQISGTASDGVEFNNTDDSIIQSNQINTTAGPGDDGIYLNNGSTNNTIDGNVITDVVGQGMHIKVSSYNVISNNTVSGSTNEGLYTSGSFYSVISGNNFNDNDSSGASATIVLSSNGDDNIISDNHIWDSSDGSDAINIGPGNNRNRLSNNVMIGTDGISDGASDTVYSGQEDNFGNLLQGANGGLIVLRSDTYVSTGNFAVGIPGGVDGAISFARAANTNGIDLTVADQTVSFATITIPDVAGVDDEVCLLNLGNCSGSSGTAFVQGGNAFGANAVFGTTDLRPLIFKTDDTEQLRLTTDGDFGIGTPSPDAKLDVQDDVEAIVVQPSGITTNGGLKSSPTIAFKGKFDNDPSAGITVGTRIFKLQNTILAGGASPDYRFDLIDHFDNELLSIQGNGNTGIGVTDPSTILQAAGNITAGNAGATNGSFIFERAANSNTLTLASANQTGGSATITIPNVSGTNDTVCLSTLGNCSGGANTALSNLSSVAINTSLLPDTDDAYDLGSSSLRWRDLYLGPQSIHIGESGDEAVLGYNTTTDTLELDKALEVQGGINAQGVLTPSAADTYALGSSSKEWNEIFVGDGQGIKFGLDQDVVLGYNTTNDRLELTGTGGSLYIQDRLGLGKVVHTISDGGGAGFTADTFTPTSSFVEIACEDADGCSATLSTSEAQTGDTLTLTAVCYSVIIGDTGNHQLAGVFTLHQNDILHLIYNGVWNEVSRSDNTSLSSACS